MPKKPYEAHTSKTKKAMGDFYGSGVKQKVGISRSDSMMNPTPKSKLKKPPKSMA